MPKLDPKAVLRAAAKYVKQNPDVAKRVVFNAVAMKVTVPLDLLRYLAAQNAGKKNAPTDVVLEAQSPALRLAASVSAMGTPLRVGAAVRIEDIRISTEEIRIELRLADILARVEGPGGDSPIAALLMSGALDLSKPGNLVRYMPKRPPALVEAEDDRIVLDLMKVDKIAQNPRVKSILELITPVLGIKSVRADDDSIVIALAPKLSGFSTLVERVRTRISARHLSHSHHASGRRRRTPMIRGLQTKTLVRLRDHLLDTGQRKSMFVAGADAYEHPLEGDDEAKAFFDAVAETMFLMIASDGKIEQSEKEVFRGALKELTGGAMRTGAIEQLTTQLGEALISEGQAKRLEAVCAVLKEREEAAEAGFVLAAAIAFADDEIADSENEVLNELADKLGISEERAEQLLDELEKDSE